MAVAKEDLDIAQNDKLLAQHLLENPMPESLLHRLKKGAKLIKKMGDQLDLDDLVIDTAVVYLRRYFSLKVTRSDDVNAMVPSCLFLATKDGPAYRDASSIAQTAHYCLYDEPLGQNKAYKKTSDVVKFETVLVDFLGCNLNVDLPHSHVRNFLNEREIDNDSRVLLIVVSRLVVRETNFCILYPPKIVTSFCIIFVYYWRNLEPPSDTNEVHWSEDYGATYSKMIKTFTSCLLQRFELNYISKFFSLRNYAQKRESVAPVLRTENNPPVETNDDDEVEISPARGADNFLRYFHDRTVRKNEVFCTEVNKVVDAKPVGYIDNISKIENPPLKLGNGNEVDVTSPCRANTNVQVENLVTSRTNYSPEISKQQHESTEGLSRMEHNFHNRANEYFEGKENLTYKIPSMSNASDEKNVETYSENLKVLCELKKDIHSIPEVDRNLPDTSNVAEIDLNLPDTSNVAEIDLNLPDTSNVAEIDLNLPDTSNVTEADRNPLDTSNVTEVDRNLQCISNIISSMTRIVIDDCSELEPSRPDRTDLNLEKENISDGWTTDYFEGLHNPPSRNPHFESIRNTPSRNPHFESIRNTPSRNPHIEGVRNTPSRNPHIEGVRNTPSRNPHIEGVRNTPSTNPHIEGVYYPPGRYPHIEGVHYPPGRNPHIEGVHYPPGRNPHIEGVHYPPGRNPHIEGVHYPPGRNPHIEGVHYPPGRNPHIEGVHYPPGRNPHIEGVYYPPGRNPHIEGVHYPPGRYPHIEGVHYPPGRNPHIEGVHYPPGRNPHIEGVHYPPGRNPHIEGVHYPPGRNPHIEGVHYPPGRNPHIEGVHYPLSRNPHCIESMYNIPTRTNDTNDEVNHDYFNEERDIYFRNNGNVEGTYDRLPRYQNYRWGDYDGPARYDCNGGEYDGPARYHYCNESKYSGPARYHYCNESDYGGPARYHDCNEREYDELDGSDEYSNIPTGINNYCDGVNKESSGTNIMLETDHNISVGTEYYYRSRFNQTNRTDEHFEPERIQPTETNCHSVEENIAPREINAYLEESNNMLSNMTINNLNDVNNLPSRYHQ